MTRWLKTGVGFIKAVRRYGGSVLRSFICPELVRKEQELKLAAMRLENQAKAIQNAKALVGLAKTVPAREQLEAVSRLLEITQPDRTSSICSADVERSPALLLPRVLDTSHGLDSGNQPLAGDRGC